METYPLVLMVVMALATARVTRLITRDRILQAPRRAVLRALPDDSLRAYVVVCDWCVSMYVGTLAAVYGAAAGRWSWDDAVFMALAFSYVTGWLASKEGDD
ncbi:hypothetical protein [Nocardioides sp. NPDC006273]|uniref:hypothetical protein n=1 Tax=Actinomycetes TaxID=1760 RepID=UPI0033B548E7